MSSMLLLSAAVLAKTSHTDVTGHEYMILQGDIQVPVGRDGEALSSAGVNRQSDLWPLGKVDWTIETGSTNPSNPASYTLKTDDPVVLQTISHWESKTCIRFNRCSGSCSGNHLMFISDNSQCNSPVGMNSRAGKNQINLSDGCGLGASIHEVGHSMGLAHEQARNDRDEFIYVDFSQIKSGMEHNFDKSGTDGRAIGPYDYGSIMHYSASGFSIGNKPTIVSPFPIGQREGLSAGDVEGIHFMYNDCSSTFTAPRCIASQETGKTHIIPHSKDWIVEFNGLYTEGATMTLTYDGTTAPESMMQRTVASGGTTGETSTTLLTFTPASSEQGKVFTISATFESGGQSATCSVEVSIASSDAVCFGISSDDPTVCASRGKCVDDPLAPCQCNSGYGGLECYGFDSCPTNELDPFDEDIGTWSPLGNNVKKVADFVALGGGAFLIGPVGADAGQAQLELLAPSHPERITFYLARYDEASTMTFDFRGGDGSSSCFDVRYGNGAWSVDGVSVGAEAVVKTWYHFDLHVDWTKNTNDLYIDGHLETKGASFGGSCSAGLTKLVFFGNGYLDELHMWCTSFILLTGSVVEGLTQDQLRAGGTSVTLTLVGDYDEWIDTTENKQRIIDSMEGNGLHTAGWNKAKSSMLDTSLVNIDSRDKQVVVIGPLKADSAYKMDATELVDFLLTGNMFKSGQTPIWSARDVEFQIPGECHHSLRQTFDSTAEANQYFGISTSVKKEGGGSGNPKSGYKKTIPAGGIRAQSLTWWMQAGTTRGQFAVSFLSDTGSELKFCMGCTSGYFSYEAGSSDRAGTATAGTWTDIQILIDWTAKTFELKVAGASVATGVALPSSYEMISKVEILTFDSASYIDDLHLACEHRDPNFEVKPECPKIGKDATTLHFFPGTDPLSTADKVALIPESSADCSNADTECQALDACSASTGSLLMDNTALEWGAGVLPTLKGGDKYKVCIYPASAGHWFLIDHTFDTCADDNMTPAPDTDAPATDAPATDVPATDAPATDAPMTDAPATDAPATDAPATDAPATDAPATDAPGTDAPATDAPATDAPATDAPATDAPATDAPATDAPATDAPATDAPMTDAPATDAPATDAPATDAPATAAPATIAPTALPAKETFAPPTDAPATDAPATDAPATDAPMTDAPATDAPATEAPATDAPATDAPATNAPDTIAPTALPAKATFAPDTDAPATDAPATDAPATDAPATDAPATDAPATDAPMTDAPATDAPLTDAPPTVAPTALPAKATFAPDTDAPATDVPPTDAPVTTAPMTTAPLTDAPSTVAPTALPAKATFAPDTDAPPTDVPPTDAPATNPPATTAPLTRPPVTTAPLTNAPATNAPPTAEPTALPAKETFAPDTDAPATNPPATTVPLTRPPMTTAPLTSAPATNAPPTAEPTALPAKATFAPDTDAPATNAPDTSVPATGVPDTLPPLTNIPDTNAPPTAAPTALPAKATFAPDTGAPPTGAPATTAPATEAPHTLPPLTNPPATGVPPTRAPRTGAPATNAPPTDAPATDAPTALPVGSTLAPPTNAPATGAPDTDAPPTRAPRTPAPETDAPPTYPPDTAAPTALPARSTYAPDTTAPATNAPDTNAPPTEAPHTLPPLTEVPPTNAPPTASPTDLPAGATHAPPTSAPATDAPRTNAPPTRAPHTLSPLTNAPDTDAPPTASPTALPAGATFAPATRPPLTSVPKTDAPATALPTTSVPTDSPPGTSLAPETKAPETLNPLTAAPDTMAPSGRTLVPGTTAMPTTDLPAGSTYAPTTTAPETLAANETAEPQTVYDSQQPETELPEGATWSPSDPRGVGDEESSSDDDGSSFPWWIFLIIGGVLCCCAAGGMAMWRMRKPERIMLKDLENYMNADDAMSGELGEFEDHSGADSNGVPRAQSYASFDGQPVSI